jgi:phage protein D
MSALATPAVYDVAGSTDTEPFYVPTYQVLAGPSPRSLSLVPDVTRVAYKDQVNQLDSFDFTVNNGDWLPGAPRHGFLPGQVDNAAAQPYGPPLLPGMFVRLAMGYVTALRPQLMLTGRITAISPSYAADGGMTVTVRTLSNTEQLREQPKNHRWTRPGGTITDAWVVQQIAAARELEAVIPAGMQREGGQPSIAQTNETDLAFLVRRARQRGALVFFRERAAGAHLGGPTRKLIYFGPSNMLGSQELTALGERQPPYTIGWGSSLLEFRPTINISTTLWKKVTVKFWNRRTKRSDPRSCELKDLWAREDGLNRDLKPIIEAAEMSEKEVSDIPVHTREEAEDLARNLLRDNFVGLVTGDGTTLGLPDVRACSTINLTGTGKLFDGTWFITGTTHTIDDSGYRTQFTGRREHREGASG